MTAIMKIVGSADRSGDLIWPALPVCTKNEHRCRAVLAPHPQDFSADVSVFRGTPPGGSLCVYVIEFDPYCERLRHITPPPCR